MFGTELYIALVIGVVLSLIYTERTGIMPAGLIVPGYLALVFDQVIFLVMIFFLSFITYLIVTQVVGRVTILYGRRKFAAMMTVGILVKMIFDYFYPIFPFETVEFRGLGVIVPGLIANAFQRQGVLPTTLSTLVLSGITFLIVSLLYFL
ncbi:capsular biosynthesis protein [Bacillaceae bacterium JMAK1]|uniref:poly-gamma-glutamate biosynthesis protein PgsC n=1 Tax=Geomicrobium sp. JCM 19055 TaxID=1460649 RepID=UPI00045ECC68|nr:poly-gamma-glutamate biosynthesis protein PgsC [Geomicrobium sp. JCM 19055]EZH66907.1 capsular biosynthesis protein [Bacillaceae bacterium JMAK1]GAJ99268.1 poly-gamma-glutamate synthase subunit PgsC/CapC [Geomicrobium sp. JCM 19055]